MNHGTLFLRAVKKYPDRIAVVDYTCGKRFTYSQTNDRANRLANGLLGLGLEKGDRVAVLMFNCYQAVESDIACAKSGIVKVALNTRLSPQEMIEQFNNSESSAIILDPLFIEQIKENRKHIPTIKHLIVLSDSPEGTIDYEKLLEESSADEPDVEVEMDDIWKLQYTSGTSGVLKAAILTHRNHLQRVMHMICAKGIDPGYHVVRAYIAPVTHAAGGFLWVTYMMGGTNLLIKMNPFSPQALLEIIEKERVTDILLIPIMVNLLLDCPDLKKYNISSLRNIGYGTAPLSPDRVKQAVEVFGPILMQGYGQSESASIGTYLSMEDHVTNGDPDREKRLSSIGTPAYFADLRIVDENGDDVSVGEVGEIILRGDFVMAGYWKDPEKTAETIKDGWLYTRDMGKIDEAGYVYLTDRKSDMIISGGFNIYPTEVENALMKHHAVFEAAVISIPDDLWGESVKAFVVLKSGMEVSEDELIQHCKEHLANYKKPKSIDIVDSLPKSPVGKIVRRLIREPYWQGKEKRIN